MRTKELTVSGVEGFPGESDTLRADNARLRHLLRLSEEQARAAASDQATLTGALASPVTMGSSSAQFGSHRVAIDQPTTGQLPVDGSDLLTPQPVLHVHPTTFQYRGDADPTAPRGIAEIYRALVADNARLDQIVADVLTASETGANILVLTHLG